MQIVIKEKCKPFSHIPGASCVIPGTYEIIEAFPVLLRVAGHEVKLSCTGPVQGFTLELDIERHCVFVFGRAKEGYYKIRVEASPSGFYLHPERGSSLPHTIHIKKEVDFVPKAPLEHLFLGSHKRQNWEKIGHDLKTAVPILFSLGQKGPLLPPQPLTGTALFLQIPEDRRQIFGALEALFLSAFSKMLIPRLFDDQYQGIVPDGPVEGNRFFILQESAKFLRSLFFQQNERRLKILPHLPIPFDCGKMTCVKVEGVGEIDFEWSKKVLRKAVLRASTTGEILLDLQKEIKSLRVNKSVRHKATEPLLIQAGKSYSLDRFQK
jgi:hypothetical protein